MKSKSGDLSKKNKIAYVFFYVFAVFMLLVGVNKLRVHIRDDQILKKYYHQAPNLLGLEFSETMNDYVELGYWCEETIEKYVIHAECAHSSLGGYPKIIIQSKTNNEVFYISFYYSEEQISNSDYNSIDKLVELGQIGMNTDDQMLFLNWVEDVMLLQETDVKIINDTWYELTINKYDISLQIGYH